MCCIPSRELIGNERNKKQKVKKTNKNKQQGEKENRSKKENGMTTIKLQLINIMITYVQVLDRGLLHMTLALTIRKSKSKID